MTQTERVMSLLRYAGAEGRGITNVQFAENRILRYGGFIKVLRDRGVGIKTIRPDEGHVWTYVLIHDPSCKCKADGPMFCPIKQKHGEVLYEA